MVLSINRGTRPLEGAYTDAAEVTKSDVTVLAVTSALWVGDAGDVVVRIQGAVITLTNVPAGSLLKIAVDQVRAATSAGSIIALY